MTRSSDGPPPELAATVTVADPLKVYTVADVAAMLGCSPATVEDWARAGNLPGLKPGGSWVFPALALATVLNSQALEQARMRRQAPKPSTRDPVAVAVPLAQPKRRGPKPRTLPQLVDMRGLADK